MGHDIGYNDIMAINLACRRYGMKAFRPPFLDTSRLILRHLSREAVGGKTGLAALLAHFNIPIHRHHEALADCEATLLLYEAVAKGNQETKKATLKAAGKEAPLLYFEGGGFITTKIHVTEATWI